MDYDTPFPRYCAKFLTKDKVTIVLDGRVCVVALVDAVKVANDIFIAAEAAK